MAERASILACRPWTSRIDQAQPGGACRASSPMQGSEPVASLCRPCTVARSADSIGCAASAEWLEVTDRDTVGPA